MRKRRIQQALGTPLERKQNKLRSWGAWLGNGANVVTASGNDVWVTLLDGSITTAFNNRVPKRHGLAVTVGYSAEQPKLFQVLSTRSDAPLGVDGGAGEGYAPAIYYQWMAEGGGIDPLFVELRQFLPLRPGAGGGMLLQIYKGNLWNGSDFYGFTTTSVDLTAKIPSTAGKAAWVLVTINDSLAVVQTKGSEVDLADLPTTARPAVPSGTLRVIAAVRVRTGQTAIQEARTNTDIVDLRWAGWETGGVARSGSTTDEHLAVWNGTDADSIKDGGAVPAGGGDVYGPATSTDNTITRFNGTDNKTIQGSLATVDDSGGVNIPSGQTYNINGSPHAHASGVSRSGSTTDDHLAVWNGTDADSIKDGGAVPAGGGDVLGNASVTDGHLAVFDEDGYHIKDGGAVPEGGTSDLLAILMFM